MKFIKYSFDPQYSKSTYEEAIELLETTLKPIKYTYGFKFKHPTTYMVDVSKDWVFSHIHKDSLVEIAEGETYVDINEYSSNDLW